MKTKLITTGILLFVLNAVNTVSAQEKTEKNQAVHNGYMISNDNGKTKESIQTVIDNTVYKIEITDGKIMELYVDGKLIPAGEYTQYDAAITKIKEQARLDKMQAKKDQEQAMRGQKQAKLDQEQASRNQQQAKLDQEMSMKDQANAKLAAERASKDQQQEKLDQEQAMKDQQRAKLDAEAALKDQVNTKLAAEQASKDQQQAKQDQEQAMKDQALAKLDQKQSEEDQRLLKQLLNDLIKDGIAPDEKSLISVTLSATELMVNDKKQPADVFTKYKEKYTRFSTGHFSFTNAQNGNKTIHMNR